jgi:2-dehydro-3-deoxygluconokinase
MNKQKKKFDLVTFGESMIQLVPSKSGLLRYADKFYRFVAGAESNTAIGLSRLGHNVGWFSRLGDDEFGQAVLNSIKREGVDVSRVIIDEEYPTGVYFKEVHGSSNTRVYYYRKDSAASRLSSSDLDLEYLKNSNCFYFSGITPALSASCNETVLRALTIVKESNIKVIYDPNVRLKLWDVNDAKIFFNKIIGFLDLVLAGSEEIKLLTGTDSIEYAGMSMLNKGLEQLVIKKGNEGSFLYTQNEIIYEPIIDIKSIESVGAGDAFNAGYISGFLKNYSLQNRLKLGNFMGGMATRSLGDIEGLPSSEEINSFLDDQKLLER